GRTGPRSSSSRPRAPCSFSSRPPGSRNHDGGARVGESAVRGRGVNVRFRHSDVRSGGTAGVPGSPSARRDGKRSARRDGSAGGRQAEAVAAFSRFFFLPPAPAWPFSAFGAFSFFSPFLSPSVGASGRSTSSSRTLGA